MDVALTVIDHGDHRSRAEDVLGLLGRADPAPRFFLLWPPFLMRYGNPPRTGPNLTGNKPRTGMALCIQRQHGMQLAMPRPTPLPISPGPRRRSVVVRKLISLVSPAFARAGSGSPAHAGQPPQRRSAHPSLRAKRRASLFRWPEIGHSGRYPTGDPQPRDAGTNLRARPYLRATLPPFIQATIPEPTQRIVCLQQSGLR
jgi:hypothetical protein